MQRYSSSTHAAQQQQHRQSAAAQTICSSTTSPSQQQHTRKKPQQAASLRQHKSAIKSCLIATERCPFAAEEKNIHFFFCFTRLIACRQAIHSDVLGVDLLACSVRVVEEAANLNAGTL